MLLFSPPSKPYFMKNTLIILFLLVAQQQLFSQNGYVTINGIPTNYLCDTLVTSETDIEGKIIPAIQTSLSVMSFQIAQIDFSRNVIVANREMKRDEWIGEVETLVFCINTVAGKTNIVTKRTSTRHPDKKKDNITKFEPYHLRWLKILQPYFPDLIMLGQ
jgi:hypothetical protein